MSKSSRALLGGAALMLCAGGAYAATLEASGANVDYLVVGDAGELSSFGAGIDFAQDVSVDGAELSLAVGIPLDGSPGGASGGFDVTDEDGVLLDGTLSAFDSVEDAIELTFGDLRGPLADSFGSTALMRIDFDDQLGASAIDGLVDGNSYLAAITLTDADPLGGGGPQIAPVPLPATGILMSIYLAMTGLYGYCRHLRSRGRPSGNPRPPSGRSSLSAHPI